MHLNNLLQNKSVVGAVAALSLVGSSFAMGREELGLSALDNAMTKAVPSLVANFNPGHSLSNTQTLLRNAALKRAAAEQRNDTAVVYNYPPAPK
jgi:hypothetical protein